MKLSKCVMIFVTLMVILSVFSKKVNRSKAASGLLTKMDEPISIYCYNNGIWDYSFYVNIDSLSGIIFKNSSSSQVFSCKYMNKFGMDGGHTRFFINFRDFSNSMNSSSAVNYITIFMKGPIVFYNIYFGPYKTASELSQVIDGINLRRETYISTFRQFRSSLDTAKLTASSLTSRREMNIGNRQQLNEAINTKRASLVLTKHTIRALTKKSDAAKEQIKNYENKIAPIKTNKRNPLLQKLQTNSELLKSIQNEIKKNEDKIKDVVPINQNDLVDSTSELLAKLKALNALYLAADPKHIAIKNLIDNFATEQNSILDVINA